MLLPLHLYDTIVLAFSGGKDCIAAFLWLREQGIDLSRLELWHQAVDGRHEHHVPFFDWPSTDQYCEAFAAHFGVGLHYQWRANGILGEMYREDALTADVYYEGPDGIVHHLPTTSGGLTTRLRFPAKSASLESRWCSAYAKIMVSGRALTNRADLQGTRDNPKKILFISGERRQESKNREGYAEYEYHRAHCQSRIVHHYRPVIDWPEEQVWAMLQAHQVQPHPCYYLGFPRKSCRRCIFLMPDQWATLADIDPESINELEEVEQHLGFTLDNRLPIRKVVAKGTSRYTPDMEFYRQQADNFTMPIITDRWELPCGAYGKGGGAI